MDQEAWLSVVSPPPLYTSFPLSTLLWPPWWRNRALGFCGPRGRKQRFCGAKLVSIIYGSFFTDHPPTHPSLGSQHEPHSPLHRKHGSCHYAFHRAASKQLRPLLTMTLTGLWHLLQVIFNVLLAQACFNLSVVSQTR